MKSAVAAMVLLAFVTMRTPCAQTVPRNPQVEKIIRQMAAENAMNVGQVLPAGIPVLLGDGDTVDLRSQLRGRTILVKVKPGHCPPCQQLLAFIRANAATFPEVQRARIMVLMTDSHVPPELSMPTNVTVLHTPSKMNGGGFLGSKWTPTTFFFDADHRLVKRTAGLIGEPENVLQFPATTARK